MSPNDLLNDLADRAFWHGFYLNGRGKVGEFYQNLPEEQKEVLRQLKSSDIDVRLDIVKQMAGASNGQG